MLGCEAAFLLDTSSGAEVSYPDEFLEKYNIVGYGKNTPVILEAEKLLARSPSDYSAYEKYRNKVLVTPSMSGPRGSVAGAASPSPQAIIVTLDVANRNGAFHTAGVLAHEAYHLDHWDAKHRQVYEYEALVLQRIGAPQWLITSALKDAALFARGETATALSKETTLVVCP